MNHDDDGDDDDDNVDEKIMHAAAVATSLIARYTRQSIIPTTQPLYRPEYCSALSLDTTVPLITPPSLTQQQVGSMARKAELNFIMQGSVSLAARRMHDPQP